MQDAQRDYQLGQRRMRIEERLAVQIVAALRDEMDLVENDLGGMAQMPEARDRRGDQKNRNNDRVSRDPRRRRRRLFDVILDLPGHREFPEELTDRVGLSAGVLHPRRSPVNRQPERDHVERRSEHRKPVARVQEHDGVERVQNVSEVDEAGDRDDREHRQHLGRFQSQRHRQRDRRIHVALVHPGRDHEESKNRDERREQQARRRAAAPQDPRDERVERHQQAHAEREDTILPEMCSSPACRSPPSSAIRLNALTEVS